MLRTHVAILPSCSNSLTNIRMYKSFIHDYYISTYRKLKKTSAILISISKIHYSSTPVGTVKNHVEQKNKFINICLSYLLVCSYAYKLKIWNFKMVSLTSFKSIQIYVCGFKEARQ